MNKRLFVLTSVAVALLLMVVACGTPTTPAPAPTQAPAQPTAAPAQPTPAPAQPTEAPKPTEAPAGQPTAVPTPTIPPPVLTTTEGCAPNATKIVWFIGLGAGSQPDDVKKEKAWADKYNKSQTQACVVLNVVYNTGSNSYDALRAQIAAGNPPDIVGPVGKAGRANFLGSWADITPLAKAAGFDLTKYDPNLLEFTKDEGVLVGIPFALFPSFIYYNKALFDEAKLPYPPHKVGEKYDGKDWNLENFTELAKKLTVDAKGNDATSKDFDAKNIKQFGFFEQWTDGRGVGTFFGGGLPYDPKDPKTAVIPEHWKAAWKWYYDAIWKEHFIPNADYANSDQFGKGNVFSSGNLAMSWVHTWYTCCFDLKKTSWDIAVMPTINSKITAKLHGDTFAIMRDSKNKELAFQVLTQMVVDKDLYQIYGGMPAKVEDRAAFFAGLDERSAPNKVDWAVAEEMLKYPDLPNHEAWLPNVAKAKDIFDKWQVFLTQTPDVDMDKAIAKLQADLDAVFKEAPAQ
ncbi:MAG: extracellular solute-binding protein [Chloroflexi bacterium]|nr:extracellular solute-binding protein [Chloroflexota bacterium]